VRFKEDAALHDPLAVPQTPWVQVRRFCWLFIMHTKSGIPLAWMLSQLQVLRALGQVHDASRQPTYCRRLPLHLLRPVRHI